MSSLSQPNQNSSSISFWSFLWSLLWILLLVLVIFKFVIFQQVTVVGKSMLPNYEDGQLLLVNQIDKKFNRGQVVAVYEDQEVARDADYFTRFSARFFLKRIVGLPNEEIEIVGGNVIVYNDSFPDGAILEETYIPNTTKNSEEKRNEYFPKTKVMDNHYFVMGDNRSNSTDSRSKLLGQVADFAMFGQESIRFWPTNKIELFDLPQYRFLPLNETLISRREELAKIKKDTVRVN